MGKIFISYRREDDPGFALALFERLERSFPTERLFMDVEGGIKAGDDFVRALEEQVSACDVMLALIGAKWLTVMDEMGRRRLDNPQDFVRIEIESALRLGKRVIPVLLHKTEMPRADALPEPLKPLAQRNAVGLRQERFKADAQGLINALEGALAEAEAARRQAATKAAAEEQRRAELANWDFIKASENSQDFRDHLARFPKGVTERMAWTKLEALVWAGLAQPVGASSLQGFLEEFPNGVHAGEAKSQLAELEHLAAAARDVEERQRRETEAWASASAADNVAALEAFLNDWPESNQANVARKRIEEIKGVPTRRWLPQGLGAAGKKPAPAESLNDRWSMLTVVVIGSAATIFAVLLLGNHGISSPWRDWSTTLLTVVSVLTLIAMTLGLALFYAAEDGPATATLERLLITIGTIALVWIIFGYSLTFTGGSDFIGGFSRAFLIGLTGSRASTFTPGVNISELSYVIFQGCLAAITPALVVGMLGNRMKLAAIVIFALLWVTLIHFPIAHMVWYWAGPDAISDAVKALAAARDVAARTAAQAKLDEINADAGWIFQKGAIDYAGGTVIAINAGLAGLIGSLFIDGTEASARNSLRSLSAKSALGLLFMWLAWFGLNAASYLDFGDPQTKVALANCFFATGAAAIAGAAMEWIVRHRTSLRGVLYSSLAGIVAVTPASAFSGAAGAIVLGLCAGAFAVACLNASRAVGFGGLPELPIIYLSSGILGTLLTGVVLNPGLGGWGVFDYTTGKISDYALAPQIIAQLWGVGITLAWGASVQRSSTSSSTLSSACGR